jgi:hypothetical protein
MSTQDLLKGWLTMAHPTKSREEMIKEYGIRKAVFLERMSEFLTPEVVEQIQQMPDDTYFWPTSVGDFAAGSTEELVTIAATFEYERTPQ